MIRQLLDLKSSAKVNLTLDIVGTRNDGYHLLESIFHEVPIYDTLAIAITDNTIIDVQCITKSPKENVPNGDKNITYKTAKKFLDAIGDTSHGVSIGILKNIPSQAGLGGGSSNSACVLKALNQMFDYPLTNDELIKIGSTIGADVPFFLMGGTVYATGIGDILTSLRPLPKLNMVVAKGFDGISTPQAYKSIDELENMSHIDNKSALECVKTQDIPSLCKYCGNVFEQIALPSEIFDIKKSMLDCGALCSLMTGSGSAVFGIFDTPKSARECFNRLNVPIKFLI
ncbi:MAG: 4-(cytidine 5'-diphospho)-2-C-methyl-D-erythritol kinase [Oscillospiraceae bacterium]